MIIVHMRNLTQYIIEQDDHVLLMLYALCASFRINGNFQQLYIRKRTTPIHII